VLVYAAASIVFSELSCAFCTGFLA